LFGFILILLSFNITNEVLAESVDELDLSIDFINIQIVEDNKLNIENLQNNKYSIGKKALLTMGGAYVGVAIGYLVGYAMTPKASGCDEDDESKRPDDGSCGVPFLVGVSLGAITGLVSGIGTYVYLNTREKEKTVTFKFNY